MRGSGVNEGYHIHEVAMHDVFASIHSLHPDRYYTDCDCGWEGKQWDTYLAAELEASNHLVKSGLPRCITCSRAAIYNSILGFCHWSVEYQHGIPHRVDESGHEAMIEW